MPSLNKSSVFVAGIPRPTPKKDRAGGSNILIPHDWKTRTDPISGKKVRYDVGGAKAWAETVRRAVERKIENDPVLRRIERPSGVRLRYHFFLTRPKSSKYLLPTVPPDLSNFEYHIENALSGTLYDDDAQVFSRSGDKQYADGSNVAGLFLTWEEVPNERYRP